jgi:hypothetical protein
VKLECQKSLKQIITSRRMRSELDSQSSRKTRSPGLLLSRAWCAESKESSIPASLVQESHVGKPSSLPGSCSNGPSALVALFDLSILQLRLHFPAKDASRRKKAHQAHQGATTAFRINQLPFLPLTLDGIELARHSWLHASSTKTFCGDFRVPSRGQIKGTDYNH